MDGDSLGVIKLLRLVAVVIVVTFLTFWLHQARRPATRSSKVKPFAPPAERAQITRGPRPQQRLLRASTRPGSATSPPATSASSTTPATPVRDVVDSGCRCSLELMIYAQLLSLLIAIPLGVYTAYKAGLAVRRHQQHA